MPESNIPRHMMGWDLNFDIDVQHVVEIKFQTLGNILADIGGMYTIIC
jgi:DNA primase catalytic subunit